MKNDKKAVIFGTFVVFLIFLLFLVYLFQDRHVNDPNHPVLNRIRDNFRLLDPKYSEIPMMEGTSSYTENKETITLCLRKPENGEFYDMNTLMYVSLHELAHVTTKSHGHGAEFKKNFSILLRRAARIGIYDPRKPIPTRYCGIVPGEQKA